MPEMDWKNISNWRVSLLRFTAFYKKGTELEIRSVLDEVFSDVPDDIQETPKELKAVYKYTHKGWQYSATVTPGRFDLVCGTPVENFYIQSSDFPSLGTLEDVYARFESICVAIVSTEIGRLASRVAFGSLNDLPIQDRNTGYELLGEMVKIELDPDNSGEFMYRINRYRTKKVNDLELRINKVAKWSFVEQTIGEPTEIGAASEIMRQVKSCRLDLDINTNPEYQGPIDELIFCEFFSIAKELCTGGDLR